MAARREILPPGVVFPEFDDLDPVAKLEVRNQVLPHVWAALEALPDPRHAAWAEGYEKGVWDAPTSRRAENPYPSGL